MTAPASRDRSCRPSTPGRFLLAGPVAWYGLALSTAYGARAEDPGPADGSVSGGTDNLAVPLAVAAVVLAVAAFTWARRRWRTTTRTTPAVTVWGGPHPGAAEPGLSPALDARSRADLVDTDDAVRTSEEELGFAVARHGEAAAAPFTEAVAYARAELATAFRSRQRLDDTLPEDEAEGRRVLDGIIRRCADANARLDAVSGDFDRLRALEREAPEAVAGAESAFRALLDRVPAAEAALDAMRERYAPSAYAPVAGSIGEAQDRLVFATSSLNQARQAVDAGRHPEAAVRLRAAEGAVTQARVLVDGVERRAAELAEAAERLPDALTGAETDLTDAGALLKGSADDVPGGVARAEEVLGEVRAGTVSGPYDPMDALHEVVEAGAALDGVLAGIRGPERGDGRTRALLEQSSLTARSALGAATDFVGTHRGAVGDQARTRLAEAGRHWERARELSAADDPRGALPEARRAEALAVRALDLAERDVRAYQERRGPGDPGIGGGVGGAVLGGIVLGGVFGEGADGHGGELGGGLGTGGFPGGPGSFGGGATRGRRGGGV
ncbi:TPM domain-containing protein [Streptomyces halstedii]|uniref:TPM domain-containing protein n=1 Tax=Streptomyces halstedii TaxID=1944 RepID=UPI00382C9109